MKRWLSFQILIISFIFSLRGFGQNYVLPNEQEVFSFFTLEGNKIVLARDTSDAYTIFRLGTEKRVEQQYPDIASGNFELLKYVFYFRGGGSSNEGMDLNFITYKTYYNRYLIYDTWEAIEDKREVGVKIMDREGKLLKQMEADPKTIRGTLVDFRFNDWAEKIDYEGEESLGIYSGSSPSDNHNDNQQCVYNGKLSEKERKNIYPFSQSNKIRVISFNSVLERTPMEDGKILSDKIIDNIQLTNPQINQLTDILYNYNYDATTDVIYQITLGCHLPRNAIIFETASGDVLSYIEICFECLSTKSDLGEEGTGVFCAGKYAQLKEFFVSIGITHFSDDTLPESPEPNSR